MDWLGFNSGNSGILESTREYSGITRGSYGNDSGMTREYLGDSGRVRDMTVQVFIPNNYLVVLMLWKSPTLGPLLGTC